MNPTQPPIQQPVQSSPEIIIPQPKPNYLKTIIFSILGIILLALTIFLYFQNQKLKTESKVTNFKECSLVKGSMLRESYPAVCVLPSGKSFTQILTDEEKSQLIPQPTKSLIISIKSAVLQSFNDSFGKTKYVLYKIAEENSDTYYSYDIYLSSQSLLSDEAIKLFSGVQNIDGVPFITSNKDNISSKSGKKYLIFDHTVGDNTEFWLFSEDGKNIKVDLSKMGLGTTIPGMYSLNFSEWIPNSTNFKIKAISANDKKYEAIFDAETGLQVGETKDVN